MATSFSTEPKDLKDLLELAKVNGQEYMLIDDGNTSLKVKVDTLLGYISNTVINNAKILNKTEIPKNTIMFSPLSNQEKTFETSFGGTWSCIGSTSISADNHLVTIYVYNKNTDGSGQGVPSGSTGGSTTGSGIIVIPKGEDLPAVSRVSGNFYINIVDQKEINAGALPDQVVVSSNMGLKVIQ